MAAKPKIDYERLEPAWRAGVKSPRQLAAEYTEETGVSVSHAAIVNHFKKLGVPRDLAAKIKAKADSLVTAAMVTGKVTSVTTKRDSEIIEDGAIVVANIRLTHRTDIGRNRALSLKLLEELEALSDNRELFAQLSELLASVEEGEDGTSDAYEKMQQTFRGALSLPGRVKMNKELSETLRVLVALERQAYSIDEGSSEESYEDRLARLMGSKE